MTKLSNKPWGEEYLLAAGDRYCVKQLVVWPGRRVSLQTHQHRSEHWTIVRGVATVQIGKSETTYHTGRCCTIARGMVHRLSSRGRSNLIVSEVQYGDYLGDDDIVRIQDDYGRET